MEQVDRQRRSKGRRRSVAVVSADSIIPRLQRDWFARSTWFPVCATVYTFPRRQFVIAEEEGEGL